MSGPGDVGGEVSGEEAAWRDLVARFDTPAAERATSAPWPAREDLPGHGAITGELPAVVDEPGSAEATGRSDESGQRELPAIPFDPGRRSSDGFVPIDRTRVIRHAGDPRDYSPPEEEDERYVPAPLPPPPKMDAISKAAWTALICGPAYLLVGTLVGWTISGTEALLAIAAFVAGFVVLIIKMGDRPPRDDNDDGAVL